MHAVVCRTLRREYRLHCPTANLAAQLEFVGAEPELPDVALEVIDIPIHLRDGFLTAELRRGEFTEGTPYHLLSAMHRLLMADILDGNPETPLVHGATIRIEGRRLLLVGRKSSGKSTLALHLSMVGHDVEGDEHLLIREHDVIARPRTLRVKDGSLGVVAGLPSSVWDAPSLANWDGGLIRSISPTLGGRPWRIRSGPLHAIVFLVANYGGRSAAKRISAASAFERLMQEVLLPRAQIAAAAERLRQLAVGRPVYQLLLGNLDLAEWHLRHISRSLT